jgi:hypothetical protein
MTDILALDVATVTGWCRGRVGEIPRCGSIHFKPHINASNNQIFGTALRWLSEFLREDPPDLLIMESLLPPDAMKNQTSRQVRDRLAGLHGIMRGVAHLRRVPQIAEASVGDIRAHFIFDRQLRRNAAKDEVMRQCRRQGWPAKDHNEADACAIWSFACGLIDPKTALKLSPLFRQRVA